MEEVAHKHCRPRSPDCHGSMKFNFKSRKHCHWMSPYRAATALLQTGLKKILAFILCTILGFFLYDTLQIFKLMCF